jgi:hypothetical protein
MGNALKRACSATNKRGEPCRARPVTRDGKCAMHGGLSDPRAMGQAGGRGRTRSVLGISDEAADDQLRPQAKKRLESLVASDNEQIALRASAALYSYRSQAPPADQAAWQAGQGAYDKDGKRVVGLAQILELFTDTIEGGLEDERLANALMAAAAKVSKLRDKGRVEVDADFVVMRRSEMEAGSAKFTADVERLAARRESSTPPVEDSDEPAVHAPDDLAELERSIASTLVEFLTEKGVEVWGLSTSLVDLLPKDGEDG